MGTCSLDWGGVFFFPQPLTNSRKSESFISCFLHVWILLPVLSCLTRAHLLIYYCSWGDRVLVAKQFKYQYGKVKSNPAKKKKRKCMRISSPYAHSWTNRQDELQPDTLMYKRKALWQIALEVYISNSHDFVVIYTQGHCC